MKLYTLHLQQCVGNVCGGVSVYSIKPLEDVKTLRCRHVLSHEECLKPYSHYTSWNEIWEACSGWHEGINKRNFKGKLKRGVGHHDGNGIKVMVEDHKRNMYLICGAWG